MAKVEFFVEGIESIGCGYRNTSDRLEIELQMTQDQMKTAFGRFLENVPGPDFEEWMDDLIPDYRKPEPLAEAAPDLLSQLVYLRDCIKAGETADLSNADALIEHLS